MWAVEPLLVSEVNRLPIFELLTILFASSFLVTAIRLTYMRRWRRVLKQPLLIWAGGLIGVCASDYAYIHASQFAPIAHIDLIDYLWPCFAIIFTSFLPKEKFSPQHIVGTLCGLLGIYVLVGKNLGASDMSFQVLMGYLMAVGGALLWGGYSAFSRHYKHVPTEMIGMYCGLGAIICFVLHLQCETFMMPTLEEGSLVVITGATGAGIACQMWDYGVKHGNVYLLSSLTYVARMFGMFLLVCFGKEPLSMALVLACVLTSIGVYFSSISENRFQGMIRWFLFPVRWFMTKQPA